jgi:hypothetical protein
MPRVRLTTSLLFVAACSLLGAACASATSSRSSTAQTVAGPGLRVLASGLNQPKKITITSSGNLIVALSGTGAAAKSCTDGIQTSCLSASGGIDEITPKGKVKKLLTGLPSLSSGGSDAEATGPSEALDVNGRLDVLFQDENLDQTTGLNHLYAKGADILGDLLRYSASLKSYSIEAAFAPFEAQHDPNSAGSDVQYGLEEKIDSDPYSIVPYDGGFAVADAGANDLLFVSSTGHISVLATFPTITEYAAAGTYGSKSAAGYYQAQSVPDSVAVGPDGALYVGELGGLPFEVGKSSVYRVVPGQKPTVYATGFTAIGDIAWRDGKLLVLEIDHKGLEDPGISKGKPASGELVQVNPGAAATLLASTGLVFPTGLAVTHSGTVYISDYGTYDASRTFHGGEILRLL